MRCRAYSPTCCSCCGSGMVSHSYDYRAISPTYLRLWWVCRRASSPHQWHHKWEVGRALPCSQLQGWLTHTWVNKVGSLVESPAVSFTCRFHFIWTYAYSERLDHMEFYNVFRIFILFSTVDILISISISHLQCTCIVCFLHSNNTWYLFFFFY